MSSRATEPTPRRRASRSPRNISGSSRSGTRRLWSPTIDAAPHTADQRGSEAVKVIVNGLDLVAELRDAPSIRLKGDPTHISALKLHQTPACSFTVDLDEEQGVGHLSRSETWDPRDCFSTH